MSQAFTGTCRSRKPLILGLNPRTLEIATWQLCMSCPFATALFKTVVATAKSSTPLFGISNTLVFTTVDLGSGGGLPATESKEEALFIAAPGANSTCTLGCLHAATGAGAGTGAGEFPRNVPVDNNAATAGALTGGGIFGAAATAGAGAGAGIMEEGLQMVFFTVSSMALRSTLR